MLVEGLAMGAFATLYQQSNDPLLVKLCQLVMTDEAFHHKFGKIWADRTIPKLSADEHNLVEDWAAQCFQTLLFNLINAEQMKPVYASVGIDWQEAMAAITEAFGDDHRRERMKESADIFRVLIKTLLNAGIITDRTRGYYGMYVDMDELKREGDRMVGDDIADEGIKYLQAINFDARAVRLAARPHRTMAGSEPNFSKLKLPTLSLPGLSGQAILFLTKNWVACMKQAMTIMKAIQYQTKSGGDGGGIFHCLDPKRHRRFRLTAVSDNFQALEESAAQASG
jgi:hypothetical protein